MRNKREELQSDSLLCIGRVSTNQTHKAQAQINRSSIRAYQPQAHTLCSPGPTCSASWCLCSAWVFSSSAIRVCCCCATRRRVRWTVNGLAAPSLGISGCHPGWKRTRQERSMRYVAQAQVALLRAFLCRVLTLFSFCWCYCLLLFSPAPHTLSCCCLLPLGLFPSPRQCFISHVALRSSYRFCLWTPFLLRSPRLFKAQLSSHLIKYLTQKKDKIGPEAPGRPGN